MGTSVFVQPRPPDLCTSHPEHSLHVFSVRLFQISCALNENVRIMVLLCGCLCLQSLDLCASHLEHFVNVFYL